MIKKLIRILGLAAMGGAVAHAQIVSGSTTLSSAVPAAQTFVCVASATNINTPSLAGNTVGSILLVDKEAMTVQAAGISSTCFLVQRGSFANSFGGYAVAHSANEKVFVLQPVSATSGDPSRPVSAAEFLSNRQYQPQVNATTPAVTKVAFATVTDVAGKTWWSGIYVEHNTISTGACVANGSTVTTDKWIYLLYDSHGNLIANTATAGTTTAGVSDLQCIAWVTPVALGDGLYYVALQGNGTTDTFSAYGTGALPTSWPTGSVTGTFATLVTPIVLTSTYTASVGPVMQLY